MHPLRVTGYSLGTHFRCCASAFLLQEYLQKKYSSFFWWVFNSGPQAVDALKKYEAVGQELTVNQLKFLGQVYMRHTCNEITTDMRKNLTMQQVKDRAAVHIKRQWVDWHWNRAPDGIIHPDRSMLQPSYVNLHPT